MSISDFDPEILQDFLTESSELLEQLESDLMILESSPEDQELLNQIFRALHTIKGSASFLALTNLVEIAHAAETALNAARSGQVVVGRTEMDLFLAAVDILKTQFEQLANGETELEKAEDSLVSALDAIADADASAADTNAEPAAVPAETNNEPVDENSPRIIELDPSKADLVEHLVIDVQQSLAQMQAQLDRLGDPDAKPASTNIINELAEDLVKTLDFFEIEECMKLAHALEHAFAGLEDISAEQFNQVRIRAKAACTVLHDQTNEIATLRMTSRPVTGLASNLDKASIGALPESMFVQDDVEADALLHLDSSFFEGGTPDGSPSIETEPNAPVEATNPSAPLENTSSSDPIAENKPDLTKKAASPAPVKRAQVQSEQTIRVEVSRLESLMNLVGELVLQKNRVGALSEQVGHNVADSDLVEQMEVTASTLDRVTGDIQVAVMRTRLQPLDKLFGKYPRLIRDLATKTGKQIDLVIEGGETEVDKSVIEELGDPLVHLLRNSADHGVEMPKDREASGKDPKGTIKLIAGHEGSHVCLRIIDDGHGLNRDKIGSKAVERGLCTEEQLASLSDEEVFRFILEAGFSTADQVSDLSGRGVGMDVVRTNIERNLKGSIGIESEFGKGTTLTITIPLTVAIMPAMMVAVGEDVFAIPLTNITEIVRPTADMFSTVGNSPMIHLRGEVHPLLSARDIFDVPDETDSEPFVVVISFNQKLVGLRVTRVIGQQEIVIKPLDGVKREGPISGATVRNDGNVSLIVDIAELMRLLRNNHAGVIA
ncbi:MAG: chemotaxis protein CheA [Phycisphaerales bacterium]